MQTFQKFLFLLTSAERRKAGILLFMVLIMAILDMIGIASIMPFLAVLTNPKLIEINSILKSMYEASIIFGIQSEQDFLFALGVMVFVLLIVSLIFKAITTYFQLRFMQMIEYSISKRLIEGYLQQPYSWFLNRNSADLGKTILSEAQHVVAHGLRPMAELITKIIVSLTLIFLLTITDPKLAIIIGLTLLIAYGSLYLIVRKKLSSIGKVRLNANKERYTAVSEAFGAAKEIKVGGLEKYYVNSYSQPALEYARNISLQQLISQLPRFALEILAFGGMLLVTLYLMTESGTFTKALPIIALYALAGYRLIPAVQQIYVSITLLRVVNAPLDSLYNDLKNLPQNVSQADQRGLSLTNNISLKNVNYFYPNSSRTAINDMNLNIPVRSTVGLVGATGSGKTTTVDIILGLLEPQKGTLEIDGQVINKQNIRSWQKSIGYVPQNIYLADDTILANIAFGIKESQINLDDVERAAKIAKIHEFVVNELPLKYETTVGERGVRLSGGQRQRIGIARALYHKPELLILDEATSALDNITEYDVMEAVYDLNREITVIQIAHRLSTVKKCDKIFLLEKGELKGTGTFEELKQSNPYFREMESKTV